MTPDEYLERCAERLAADGDTVSRVQLPMGAAVIGYQGRFRLHWMATRLHAFTVMVPVPVATRAALQVATEQALAHAKRERGRLRGIQTGVAVLPVLVAPEVESTVVETVRERPAKAFAAIALPAVVDLESRRVSHFDGRLVWGALYSSWLHHRLGVLPEPTD